jgi:hypothetical protein
MKTTPPIQLILIVATATLALPALSAQDIPEETVRESRWPRWLHHRRATKQDVTRTVERTEDGREWTTDATLTGPGGATATMHADGTATHTEDGAEWSIDRDGTRRRGQTWTSTTTGEGTRTADGREWSSTTEGSAESGKSWSTDQSGSATINDDGSRTISTDFEKTLGNGETISGSKETTVTKTDDGREWETTGSHTGPHGTATYTADGTATRTTDGSEATVDRSGTTAAGREWSATTRSRAMATEDGRMRRSGTRGTTADGSRFGARIRSKTTPDGNTIRNKTQRTGRARRNAES